MEISTEPTSFDGLLVCVCDLVLSDLLLLLQCVMSRSHVPEHLGSGSTVSRPFQTLAGAPAAAKHSSVGDRILAAFVAERLSVGATLKMLSEEPVQQM